MALPDLLWACPECGLDRGLAAAGRGAHACRGCGTRYERARGARILARRPDGRTTVLEAAAWLDRLPDPGGILDAAEGEEVRTARSRMRTMVRTDVVRTRGAYLNRIEVLGDAAEAVLVLTSEELRARTPAGEPLHVWRLAEMTAVQASSGSLQVKARGRPLVAFEFDDDSVMLWEQLLHAALRRFYRRTGRGEIAEFQPRIAAAPGSGSGRRRGA